MVRAAVPVAYGEFRSWCRIKPVMMATQDYDVVALQSTTVDFFYNPMPLAEGAVDAVQAMATYYVPRAIPAEDCEAMLFDFRGDDGTSLTQLQQIAEQHGAVVEVRSPRYSRQFLWSLLDERLSAAERFKGADGEWWSMETGYFDATVAVLNGSGAAPVFFPTRLYAYFIDATVDPREGPTVTKVWVEATEQELAREGRRAAPTPPRVLRSSLARLSALGIALGDGRADSEEQLEDATAAVPNAIKCLFRTGEASGANLLGRLTFGIIAVELKPGSKTVAAFRVAQRPTLADAPTGIGLPVALPRELDEVQALVDASDQPGGARHVGSFRSDGRYLEAIARRAADDAAAAAAEDEEAATVERRRAEWREEAAAAALPCSDLTFVIATKAEPSRKIEFQWADKGAAFDNAAKLGAVVVENRPKDTFVREFLGGSHSERLAPAGVLAFGPAGFPWPESGNARTLNELGPFVCDLFDESALEKLVTLQGQGIFPLGDAERDEQFRQDYAIYLKNVHRVALGGGHTPKVVINPKFKAAPAAPVPAAAKAGPLLGGLGATRGTVSQLAPPSRFGPGPLTPTQENDLLALLENFLAEYDAAEAGEELPKLPLTQSSSNEKAIVSKLLKLPQKEKNGVWAANAVRELKTRVAARA